MAAPTYASPPWEASRSGKGVYEVPVTSKDQEAGLLASNSCTAMSALLMPAPQAATTEELPVELTVPYQICRTCASLSSTNTEPALDHVDTPPPVTDVTGCGQPSLMMVATSRSPVCWGETPRRSEVSSPRYPECMAGDPTAYTVGDPALRLKASRAGVATGGAKRAAIPGLASDLGLSSELDFGGDAGLTSPPAIVRRRTCCSRP